jgi:hypothetical protein
MIGNITLRIKDIIPVRGGVGFVTNSSFIIIKGSPIRF